MSKFPVPTPRPGTSFAHWRDRRFGLEILQVTQRGSRHEENEDGFGGCGLLPPEAGQRLWVVDGVSEKIGDVGPTDPARVVGAALEGSGDTGPVEAIVRADEALRAFALGRGAQAGCAAVVADLGPGRNDSLRLRVASLGDCAAAAYRRARWGGDYNLGPIVATNVDADGKLADCLGVERGQTAPPIQMAETSLRSGDLLLLGSDGAVGPDFPWQEAARWFACLERDPLRRIDDVAERLLYEAVTLSAGSDDATLTIVRVLP